jgi:hypothetical protein
MAAAPIAVAFPGIRILEQTPGALRALVATASKDDLDWQPAPDRWSISMVLAHLADVEAAALTSRFRAIANEENPVLPAYDQLALFRKGTKFDGHAGLAPDLAIIRPVAQRASRRTRPPHVRRAAQRVCVSRSGPHPAGNRAVSRSRVLPEHGSLPELLQDQSVKPAASLMCSRGWRMMLAMKRVLIFALLLPAGALWAAPQGASAPSVDQILEHYIQASGGKDALEKVSSRTMKGTLENSDDGTTSPAEVFAKAPDKYLEVVNLADGGESLQGWNGQAGWGKDPDSGLHDMEKSDQVAAKRDYDFYRETRLKELFPKMALSGKMKVDDRDAYIVQATAADGASEKLYFDAESGLLVRRDFERVTIDDGIVLYEVDYDDYKDVDGLKLPSTVRRKTPDYTLTYRFTEIRQNVPIEDTKFNKPEK